MAVISVSGDSSLRKCDTDWSLQDAGVPTRAVMEELLAAQLTQFRDSFGPQVAPPHVPPVPEVRQEQRLFEIGGKFRRAPEDFRFPSGMLSSLFSFVF